MFYESIVCNVAETEDGQDGEKACKRAGCMRATSKRWLPTRPASSDLGSRDTA